MELRPQGGPARMHTKSEVQQQEQRRALLNTRHAYTEYAGFPPLRTDRSSFLVRSTTKASLKYENDIYLAIHHSSRAPKRKTKHPPKRAGECGDKGLHLEREKRNGRPSMHHPPPGNVVAHRGALLVAQSVKLYYNNLSS